jgi:hypothetical protein
VWDEKAEEWKLGTKVPNGWPGFDEQGNLRLIWPKTIEEDDKHGSIWARVCGVSMNRMEFGAKKVGGDSNLM